MDTEARNRTAGLFTDGSFLIIVSLLRRLLPHTYSLALLLSSSTLATHRRYPIFSRLLPHSTLILSPKAYPPLALRPTPFNLSSSPFAPRCWISIFLLPTSFSLPLTRLFVFSLFVCVSGETRDKGRERRENHQKDLQDRLESSQERHAARSSFKLVLRKLSRRRPPHGSAWRAERASGTGKLTRNLPKRSGVFLMLINPEGPGFGRGGGGGTGASSSLITTAALLADCLFLCFEQATLRVCRLARACVRG